MNRTKQLTAVALTMILGACASKPQQPVAFNPGAIAGSANRVVIDMKNIPETNTSFPGASCLLCIGVARAAHSDLSTHVQTLEAEELSFLPGRLAQALSRNGALAKVLDNPVDIESLSDNPAKGDNPKLAKKDFRPLAEELGADKLLVVNIHSQGVLRPYSAYIPVDVPKAHVSGIAYMVDLRSNTYLWYTTVSTAKPAEGAWNEPPNFPGLTNAYYQVLAETSDLLVSELTNDAKTSSRGSSLTTAKTEVTQ